MIIDEDDYLEHFGVKGMKWGVRRDRTPGVSRRTDREARKDAEEMARAKMFYGKGAGTRRKLIRETVAAKSSRDPGYAEAFNRHLNDQDMSTHASGARAERRRTDRRERNRQRAGAIARRTTGEMGTQAAMVAAGAAGVAFVRSPRGQEMMRRGMEQVRRYASTQRTQRLLNDLMR